jgi:hypothetical protein
MKGDEAKPLVDDAIRQLHPYMPVGICVEASLSGRSLHLQRATADAVIVDGNRATMRPTGGSMNKTYAPAFGTWVPFTPAKTKARLVAQSIVETVLDVAHREPHTPPRQHDFAVRTRIEGDAVIVSFRPLGRRDSDRVNLAPIPFDKLSNSRLAKSLPRSPATSRLHEMRDHVAVCVGLLRQAAVPMCCRLLGC